MPIYREIGDLPNLTSSNRGGCRCDRVRKADVLADRGGDTGSIVILLRASLRRGRDSFYPAMAGSRPIALLLFSFINPGLLGTATSLIAAAVIGLGIAQSKSRTAKLEAAT